MHLLPFVKGLGGVTWTVHAQEQYCAKETTAWQPAPYSPLSPPSPPWIKRLRRSECYQTVVYAGPSP